MNSGPCAPNATQTCDVNGTQTCGADCQWSACSCNNGYTNCTGTCSNLADNTNCGACGTPCSAPNSSTTATCATGQCVSSCAPGYCGTPPSACNPTNTISRCGACGYCCPTWLGSWVSCDTSTTPGTCSDGNGGTTPAVQDSRCP
jgi:hypothetical protein